MGRAGTLIYNITRKFTCMGVNAAGMGSGCCSVGPFGYRKCLLQMYVHLLTFSWVNVALPQARAHFLHFSKSLCGFGNGILACDAFLCIDCHYYKARNNNSTAFLFGIVFFILYFVLHFDLLAGFRRFKRFSNDWPI